MVKKGCNRCGEVNSHTFPHFLYKVVTINSRHISYNILKSKGIICFSLKYLLIYKR